MLSWQRTVADCFRLYFFPYSLATWQQRISVSLYVNSYATCWRTGGGAQPIGKSKRLSGVQYSAKSPPTSPVAPKVEDTSYHPAYTAFSSSTPKKKPSLNGLGSTSPPIAPSSQFRRNPASPSQSYSSTLLPQRPAPVPPGAASPPQPGPSGSYFTQEPNGYSSDFVLPDLGLDTSAPAATKRRSLQNGVKPQRSSYIAGSRPPFSTNNANMSSPTSPASATKLSKRRPSNPPSPATWGVPPVTYSQLHQEPTTLGAPWDLVTDEVPSPSGLDSVYASQNTSGGSKKIRKASASAPPPSTRSHASPKAPNRPQVPVSLLHDPDTAAAASYAAYDGLPAPAPLHDHLPPMNFDSPTSSAVYAQTQTSPTSDPRNRSASDPPEVEGGGSSSTSSSRRPSTSRRKTNESRNSGIKGVWGSLLGGMSGESINSDIQSECLFRTYCRSIV